jgi:hypothetical protein
MLGGENNERDYLEMHYCGTSIGPHHSPSYCNRSQCWLPLVPIPHLPLLIAEWGQTRAGQPRHGPHLCTNTTLRASEAFWSMTEESGATGVASSYSSLCGRVFHLRERVNPSLLRLHRRDHAQALHADHVAQNVILRCTLSCTGRTLPPLT